MLKNTVWAALTCFIAYTFLIDTVPLSVTNTSIALFTLWVFCDGMLLAIDLKASETRIKELETQLKVHAEKHDISTSELIKKTNDNHHLMMELRTRLILVQQNLNKSRLRETNTRVSNSLN